MNHKSSYWGENIFLIQNIIFISVRRKLTLVLWGPWQPGHLTHASGCLSLLIQRLLLAVFLKYDIVAAGTVEGQCCCTQFESLPL